MNVLNGFLPTMMKALSHSGATSGATFAAAGVVAADEPLGAIVFDGNTGGFKSYIQPANLTLGAGSCRTTAVDTNADTVLLFYNDASAVN